MSQKDERRVLSRLGARELSHLECERVNGAIIHTQPCTVVNLPNGTCNMDGDCPVPLGC